MLNKKNIKALVIFSTPYWLYTYTDSNNLEASNEIVIKKFQDLEKILIKSGVASEVFRELGEGSGARLIDSVESLYTAMKNGQITMEDYLLRKDNLKIFSSIYSISLSLFTTLVK